MKYLFSFVVIGFVLYCSRETETHLDIIQTPRPSRVVEAPVLFDISYQHGRVIGDALSVVGHDVLESDFVYLRLPLSAQTGDTLDVTGSDFQYRCATTFTLIRAFVVIEAHDKGKADKLTAVLHCWLVDEQQHFQTLRRRIDVAF